LLMKAVMLPSNFNIISMLFLYYWPT